MQNKMLSWSSGLTLQVSSFARQVEVYKNEGVDINASHVKGATLTMGDSLSLVEDNTAIFKGF